MKKTLISVLFVLCAFLMAQKNGDNPQAAPALDFTNATFDWEANGIAIYPQAKIAKVETSIPRIQKVNAVRIDLTDPKIGFCAPRRAPGYGQPMPDYPEAIIRTKRMRTVEFMKLARRPVSEGGYGMNMIVASNTNPWSPFSTMHWNHEFADKLGLIVDRGELVSEGNGRAAFIVTKDRKFLFDTPGKDYDISNVDYAVTGFSYCMRNSKVEGNEDLHPRTGYGLSADRKYLVIVTIDGRQKGYSEGCTVKEVGHWLKYFGCSDGVNMDGGGSTTLVYFDSKADKVVKMNHQAKGAERSNGGNFGIILIP
ncbi:MAG: phosphodiester glycosidase family protein [Victivallales bacterium]|nr:phosphodiester glycosidase family protein [Victivallales bacterium]